MVDLFRLSVGENGAISVTANAWVALVLIVVGVGAIFAFAWVRDAVFRQKF
jgi:hypothetical protein